MIAYIINFIQTYLVQICSFIAVVIWPAAWDLVKIKWKQYRTPEDKNKIIAQTDVEKANADKTSVETIREIMDQQKIVFDQRVQMIEDGQKEMQVELKALKEENVILHAENKKLLSIIKALKSVIIELKVIVKKLMDGVNKLLDYFKKNDLTAPWELVLTTKEDAILRADYSEDSP